MFLGMSIITIAEALMYLTKIAWIAISRKRREYMYTKKEMEKVLVSRGKFKIRGILGRRPSNSGNS